MENNTNTIDLVQFRQMFPLASCLSMGDDVCLVNVRYDKSLRSLSHPCRFDGFLAFFCISGHIKVMINLTEFNVVENSLFVYLPGNIISISAIDENEKENLEFLVIAMTKEYVESLNVKTYKFIERRLQLQAKPFFLIRDGERMIAHKYVALAADILGSNLSYKRESISALVSSFFFIAGGIMEQDAGAVPERNPGRADRGRSVFEKFIELVSVYHVRERNVGFYAEKLCLTPKYLSKLIRSASGKGAPAWIDDYVILEAKNMLKYSDLPVKEIVSKLNFPNTSTFHKFFKARTGLTPLQYRKS